MVKENSIDNKKNPESSHKSNKILLAIIASIVGCVIGFFVVRYLKEKSWHTVILIGPFCGFSSLIFMRVRNNLFGIWCGLLALSVGIFTEAFLFNPSKPLNYYFLHFAELPTTASIPILAGAIIAFYFGRGNKAKEN